MIYLLVFLAAAGAAWTTAKVARRRCKRKIDAREAAWPVPAVYRPAMGSGGIPVYTVATRAGAALDRLCRTCNREGLGVHVVGLGARWRGFGNKWLWTLDYLRRQGLPADQLMVFVDAYDVVNLARQEELAAKFGRSGARIIFSAETNCYPDPDLAGRYPGSPTRFRYLNSGGAIGYAGEFMRIIEEIRFKATDNDQGGFTKYFLEHPGEIVLDTDCDFFVSLFGLEEADFEFDPSSSRFTLRETGTRPCFLHGNGPSVDLLEALERRRNASRITS